LKWWYRGAALLLTICTGSCNLGTGVFAGKSCKTNVECPDPYVCAMVRPEGRTCELLRGVETFDPSSDNPAYYCGEVKAILDKHCVSNCHGQQRDYPGTMALNFRLDVYQTGTVIPGAFEKAMNINNRIQADTMPPMVMGYTRATAVEKTVILRWVNSGAPECDGGSMPMGDAGSTDGGTDGGSGDAGRRDGG